jgi:hypothetical protein
MPFQRFRIKVNGNLVFILIINIRIDDLQLKLAERKKPPANIV